MWPDLAVFCLTAAPKPGHTVLSLVRASSLPLSLTRDLPPLELMAGSLWQSLARESRPSLPLLPLLRATLSTCEGRREGRERRRKGPSLAFLPLSQVKSVSFWVWNERERERERGKTRNYSALLPASFPSPSLPLPCVRQIRIWQQGEQKRRNIYRRPGQPAGPESGFQNNYNIYF